jgi:hypothetical protein
MRNTRGGEGSGGKSLPRDTRVGVREGGSPPHPFLPPPQETLSELGLHLPPSGPTMQKQILAAYIHTRSWLRLVSMLQIICLVWP